MPRARRSSSFKKPLVWGSTLCLLLIGMGVLLWSSLLDSVRQGDEIVFTASLPPRPTDAGNILGATFSPGPDAPAVDGALANPGFTEPALDPLKPNEPDLALVDASPFGPLPRIAEDGRRALETYARPADRRGDRPRIAVLVTGLGLQADATNAAFHLPGAISLLFSPYGDDLPAAFERARLAGHEVLLELPMEPADYPANDPGPHTLRASDTVDANIERLSWVLARAPGYFAVAGKGGAFATSPEAMPVMQALAKKGIGMIEIDGDHLAGPSGTVGLPYLSAPDWIDGTPSAGAIDQALNELEARARREGRAIGVAEAYPVTLKHLATWATTLEERGMALVPASAILLDEAGTDTDSSEGANLAQSRN
ncbi:MAG: divergent polysaccharide deacetylase family protein [Rhizobiales bacterium]|nr:divergent polysaccharide deacetylase family protein [Hyphomicrobiales bacterium]